MVHVGIRWKVPFSLRIFVRAIIMALQADQLMRGLQLDDASMQKLELDMREEVRVCFCVSFVRRGGAFLFECKSVSVWIGNA